MPQTLLHMQLGAIPPCVCVCNVLLLCTTLQRDGQDMLPNSACVFPDSCSKQVRAVTVLRSCQVGLKTSMGLTVLHNAATNGHCEIVEALLAAGASPNARALSNATALFCAAGAGHAAIVRRLLAVGAEIGVAAGAGATALHAAAGASHLAVVEDLLGAHADVDVQVCASFLTLL